jgi:hypothetical protein
MHAAAWVLLGAGLGVMVPTVVEWLGQLRRQRRFNRLLKPASDRARRL